MFPVLVIAATVDSEEVLDLLGDLVVGTVDLLIRGERKAREGPFLAQRRV